MTSSPPILDIADLSVSFATPRGKVRALRDVSLSVPRDRIVGIVGESGCGKTTLISSILRLLAANAVVEGGTIRFEGEDVLAMPDAALGELRGKRAAMVFQDPMTALNPVVSIATQMIDIQHRDPAPKAEKRARAVAMLRRVGIPDPGERIDGYAHRFSGGQRQRIAIAMALLMNPSLLIADEPTTALDVTLEAQIVQLIRELKRDFRGSILFVSHNLGLIAELCDEVVVMYAGEVVERGDVRAIFHAPRHPYTRLLLACDPARIPDGAGAELPTIKGALPDLAALPEGCIFASRCPEAELRCVAAAPAMIATGHGHVARCIKAGHG
ncbi:MAG: ABC transporter ATP-binding protein [Alphaproteobacteria bacterium]|nr:ABC transporter ATP-binding protein [Alphaproteobacteria bacterium]